MPDLVNDPQYEGIDLDRGDMNDPEYWSPERVHKRNLWRDWAAKQRDAAAKLTEQAAQQGIDADTALANAGFRDAKDHGKYIWTLFGNQGLFATQGNVDPNLEYDWGRGVKTWKPGTENAGQSIPITRDEYDSRRQAQQYQQQGLYGYGAHANAEAFKRAAGYGHFQKDPKTGNYFNVGQGNPNDPRTWEWKDPYGRSINGLRSAGPGTGPGNIQFGGGMGGQIGYPGSGGPGPQGGGGWLPQHGGFGQAMPDMGGYGAMNGGVPNMYAGTMQATGFNQGGGGGGFAPMSSQDYRRRAAENERMDEASPYKQLMPTQRGGNTGIAGGASAKMGGF